MYEEDIIRGRIVHLPILWQVYLPRTLKYYTITDIQMHAKAGSRFLVSMYDCGSHTSHFLDVYDSDVRRTPDSFCRASRRYRTTVSKSRRRPFWDTPVLRARATVVVEEYCTINECSIVCSRLFALLLDSSFRTPCES